MLNVPKARLSAFKNLLWYFFVVFFFSVFLLFIAFRCSFFFLVVHFFTRVFFFTFLYFYRLSRISFSQSIAVDETKAHSFRFIYTYMFRFIVCIHSFVRFPFVSLFISYFFVFLSFFVSLLLYCFPLTDDKR